MFGIVLSSCEHAGSASEFKRGSVNLSEDTPRFPLVFARKLVYHYHSRLRMRRDNRTNKRNEAAER